MSVELRLRDPASHDRLFGALARLHQRDGLRLPRHCRVRGPVFSPFETLRGMEAAPVFEPGNGSLRRLGRHRARLPGQRSRQKISMGKHRLALSKMVHRPDRGLLRRLSPVGEQVREREFLLRLPCLRAHRVSREPEFRRLSLPTLPKLALVHIPFPRPRHQRRTVRQLWVIQRRPFIPRQHRRLDLRPPRREPLHHLPRYPRDLEPSFRVRLLDPVTQVLEIPGKLGPVHRADRHLVPVEPVVDHRSPLGIAALDHVGHHCMGMELRVEVAGGVVAEGCGHHLLAAHVDHRSAGLVLHPGLDGVALNPGEGALHGPVVGRDDPLVSSHQRHEGDRLRSRKGDVAARPVVDLPVPASLAQLRAVRHLAFEHGLERVGIDWTHEP